MNEFPTPEEIANKLFDDYSIGRSLEEVDLVTHIRESLAAADNELKTMFRGGTPVALLVHARSLIIDKLFHHVWPYFFGNLQYNLVLLAVGGYGRGELHPYSDIDLLIVTQGEDIPKDAVDAIQNFITFIWDIGVEVGHSVRTVETCRSEAVKDITVATNLMEARFLQGNRDLFDAVMEQNKPGSFMSSQEFFEQKREEQRIRHARYRNTAYNLEPNVKESPGGLRDLHMIGWVAKRHFGLRKLSELVEHGFLTEQEYELLIQNQNFIWAIRFGLHTICDRKEERLLFDHQRRLAEEFGFHDRKAALGIEQLMQRYFRAIMELTRLNEMLLQLFEETIIETASSSESINDDFDVINGFLEAKNAALYDQRPAALFETYLIFAQKPNVKGIRATTNREIRNQIQNIKPESLQSQEFHDLFKELLKQPQGVCNALRRMHKHGVLEKYIPAFSMITGRMQYDLFHEYTVDEHTLRLINNLEKYGHEDFLDDFPVCSNIYRRLPKQELIFLAGIFHDIAKGRGGDHSELGQVDAEEYCLNSGYTSQDAKLVSWLVANHLSMSMTAQRKDTSDPEVITEFASLVGTIDRLDYLYLLTVADIRATSEKLWNSWKDSLLLELYIVTKRLLRRGINNPPDKEEIIEEKQLAAMMILQATDISQAQINALWSVANDDYFLRYTADEIAWHTEEITSYGDKDLPLVLMRESAERGGTEIFVYTQDNDTLFYSVTSALDQLDLTIFDARIITNNKGMALDSYIVLENDGTPVPAGFRKEEIIALVKNRVIKSQLVEPKDKHHVPRQLKQFYVPTEIEFYEDISGTRTILELFTNDRPGLLSRVAFAFAESGVKLQNAKVATIGARVEDVFFITDQDGNLIRDKKLQASIRTELEKWLTPLAKRQEGPVTNVHRA